MAGRKRKGATEGIPPSKFHKNSSSKKEADSLGEVCRICASAEGVFTNIFKKYQRDSLLVQIIFTCLQIKVQSKKQKMSIWSSIKVNSISYTSIIARDDELPQSLCHKCMFTLKHLKKFLKIALKKSVRDLKRCAICHLKPDKNLTFQSPIVADKLQYCSVLKFERSYMKQRNSDIKARWTRTLEANQNHMINVNVADGRKICKKCFFELECLFDMTKIALKSQDYFLSIKNQSAISIPIPPNSKNMTAVKQFRQNNPVIIEKSVLKESKTPNKNVSVIVHDVMMQYNLTENDRFPLKDNEVVKSYEGFETNKETEPQSPKFLKLRALSKSTNNETVNTDAIKAKRLHLNRSVATVKNKKVLNSGKPFTLEVEPESSAAVDRPRRSAYVHNETIDEHNKSVLKYSPRNLNRIDDQKLLSVSVTRYEVRNVPKTLLYKRRMSSFQQKVNKNVIQTNRSVKKRKKMLKCLRELNFRRNADLVSNISDSSDNEPLQSPQKQTYSKQSTVQQMVNNNDLYIDAIKTKKLHLNKSVATVKNKKVLNSGKPFDSEIEAKSSAVERPRRSAHAHNGTIDEHNKSVLKYSLRKLNRIDDKKLSSVSVTRDEVRNKPVTHSYKKRMSSFQQKVNKDVITDKPMKKIKKLLNPDFVSNISDLSETSDNNSFRSDSDVSYKLPYRLKSPTPKKMVNDNDICIDAIKTKKLNLNKSVVTVKNKDVITTDRSVKKSKKMPKRLKALNFRRNTDLVSNISDSSDTSDDEPLESPQKQTHSKQLTSFQRKVNKDVITDQPMKKRKKLQNPDFVSNISDLSDTSDNNSFRSDSDVSNKLPYHHKSPTLKKMVNDNDLCIDAIKTKKLHLNRSVATVKNKKVLNSGKAFDSEIEAEPSAEDRPRRAIKVNKDVITTDQPLKKRKKLLKRLGKGKTNQPVKPTKAPKSERMSNKKEITNCKMLQKKESKSYSKNLGNNKLYTTDSSKSNGKALKITQNRIYKRVISKRLQNLNDKDETKTNKQVKTRMIRTSERLIKIKGPDFERLLNARMKVRNKKFDSEDVSNKSFDCLDNNSSVIVLKKSGEKLPINRTYPKRNSSLIAANRRTYKKIHSKSRVILKRRKIPQTKLPFKKKKKSVNDASTLMTSSDCSDDSYLKANNNKLFTTDSSKRNTDLCTYKDRATKKTNVSLHLKLNAMSKNQSIKKKKEILIHGKKQKIKSPKVACVQVEKTAHPVDIPSTSSGYPDNKSSITDQPVEDGLSSNILAYNENEKIEIVGPVILLSELACSTISTQSENNDLPDLTSEGVSIEISDNLTDDNPCSEHELSKSSELQNDVCKSLERDEYMTQLQLHVVVSKQHITNISTQERKEPDTHDDNINSSELAPTITDKLVDMSVDTHSDALHNDNIESSELAPTVTDKSVDMSVDTHSGALHDDNIESSELAPTITDKSVDMHVDTHSDALHDDNIESSELAPPVADNSVDMPVDTQSDALHDDTIELPELGPTITDKSVDISVDTHSDALHDDNTELSELAPTIADISVDMSVDNHSDASPNDLPVRNEHCLINELSNNAHRSLETKESPTEIKPVTKSKVKKKKKQVFKVKSNSEKHISSTCNNDVVELLVPYTCQICNEIFDSTVQGMLHWLKHEHENSPRVLIKSTNKSSPKSTYDSHKKKQEKSDEQSVPKDQSDSDIAHVSESHLILFLSDSDGDELVEEIVQSTPSICSINDAEYPIINKEEEVPNPQCIIDALTESEKIAQPKLVKDSLDDLTVNPLTVSERSILGSNTTKDYEAADADLNHKLTKTPEEGAETLSMIAEAVVERNVSIVENRAEIENVGMSVSSLLKHLEE